MSLNFWPRVTVRQPTDFKGQIYIPNVNNILWFGCILMILYFQTSANMEAAYGFSITIAMMMTTLLLTYYLLFRKMEHDIGFGILSLFLSWRHPSSLLVLAKIKERWMFLFFLNYSSFGNVCLVLRPQINNRLVYFVELGKHFSDQMSEDDSIPKFATHLIYFDQS